MKITKSQLKQLVMEELSEAMPDLEEGQVEEAKSWKRIQRDRAMAQIDANLKNDPKYQASEKRRKSGEDDVVVGKSYSRGHAPRGGDDEIDEGRGGSYAAQRRKAWHAANDEYLKQYDSNYDSYANKGDEDTIKRDPHGKRSREDRSEKDAKNEGRITKSGLNAIIAEEYRKLVKENYFSGGIRDLTTPQGESNAPLKPEELAKAKAILQKHGNSKTPSNAVIDLHNALYNQFNKEQPPDIYNARAAEIRGILKKFQ